MAALVDVTNVVIEKSIEDSAYGSSATGGDTARVVGRTDWTCTVTHLAGGVLAGGAGVGIMVGDKGTLTVTMSAGGVPTVTLVGKAMITKVSPVVDINTGSVEKFEIEFKGDVAAIGEILTWTGNAALTVPMSAKYTTVAWA